jgi:hypothetical protein
MTAKIERRRSQMRLPGFTAELPLHAKMEKYRGSAARGDLEGNGRLVPQLMAEEDGLCNEVCDVGVFCHGTFCWRFKYNCRTVCGRPFPGPYLE